MGRNGFEMISAIVVDFDRWSIWGNVEAIWRRWTSIQMRSFDGSHLESDQMDTIEKPPQVSRKKSQGTASPCLLFQEFV